MQNPIVATLSLVTLLVLPCSCRADGNDRTAMTAATFEKYCLNDSSDFTSLDRRATEARYEVVVDRSIPMPNGQAVRQKNWLVVTQNGAPTMLTSNDSTNGSLHVFGCGIYAPDIDGTALESALSSIMRMGSPTRHSQVADGSTVTWWSARIGNAPSSDDSQVMLARDTPGLPGVTVYLIFKTHLVQ